MFSITSLLAKSIIVIFSGVVKTRDDLCLGNAKFEYVFTNKGLIVPRFLYNALLKSYEKHHLNQNQRLDQYWSLQSFRPKHKACCLYNLQ